MTAVIKLLGAEAACNTTPSNFGLATLVRLLNTTAAAVVVTQKDATNTNTIGTMTLAAGGETFIQKAGSDNLTTGDAAQAVKAVKISFRN